MEKLSKTFIIGLPRTGTTSICCKFLELGYTVAHTAYTQKTFDQAQVVADTPIFADYSLLDNYYPNSKFIYLTRDLPSWLPSIKQLLLRMYKNVIREDGGFNPIIKRCYQQVFSPYTLGNIESDEFLTTCYLQHIAQVKQYFKNKRDQILFINISEAHSAQKLSDFLSLEQPIGPFKHINKAGKVTAWKEIKHPNKVESTNQGKVTKLAYLSNINV